MGIQMRHRRLTDGQLAVLETNPEFAITELIQPAGLAPEVMKELLDNPAIAQERLAQIMAAQEADTTQVDLDKDWHALHFLLTGDSSMEPAHSPENALHNIVMGGHPTGIETSFGPARCLSQVDVSDIVIALEGLSDTELRERCSAEEFNAHKIYPNPRPGGWDQEEVDEVPKLIPRLRILFEAALDENEVVLVFAS